MSLRKLRPSAPPCQAQGPDLLWVPASSYAAILNPPPLSEEAGLAGGGIALGVVGLNEISPSIWRPPLVFESNRSFWARSQAPPNPPLTEDTVVDVAVIGGGLTGLSAAYYMRQRSPNKRVAVLEAKGCGNGASGRNGAMVLTMTADRYMNFSPFPAVDKKIYELTTQNIQTLSRLSAQTGIDCELETNGALQVLNTSADIKAAQAYVRQAQSMGMPVEFWSKQQLADAIGTEAYGAAFFDPHGGHVHPIKRCLYGRLQPRVWVPKSTKTQRW